ncbi:MAG: hypothetical protein U1F66_12265 [bacterium]
MFWSLKHLVEHQMKQWTRVLLGTPSSLGPAASVAGAEGGATLLTAFRALQGGGELHLAGSAAVAMEEPSFSQLPSGTREKILAFPEASTEDFQSFLQEIEFSSEAQFRFPEQNPLTLQGIDWQAEISRENLADLARASSRAAKSEALSQNAKLNRLTHLLFLALRSGNISLAMMLFSHLEAATANEITRSLMQKVQNLQDHKRKLAQDLQNQKTDAEGSKNMQKIKVDMEQANDDISVLQTFIRDVAQNKQASLELANAFISKEHETTMAIVRSFAR